MTPLVEQVAFWAIAGLVTLSSAPPLLAFGWSALSKIRLPAPPQAPPQDGKDAPAEHRTPGEVLDCLNADLDYLRTNTDAPAELLKGVEQLAPYLMHKKPGA